MAPRHYAVFGSGIESEGGASLPLDRDRVPITAVALGTQVARYPGGARARRAGAGRDPDRYKTGDLRRLLVTLEAGFPSWPSAPDRSARPRRPRTWCRRSLKRASAIPPRARRSSRLAFPAPSRWGLAGPLHRLRPPRSPRLGPEAPNAPPRGPPRRA